MSYRSPKIPYVSIFAICKPMFLVPTHVRKITNPSVTVREILNISKRKYNVSSKSSLDNK